ncbi:MAG TPA: transketolase C-terminal domain-containing protein [Candidatus Bipolaricaulota bacterium]|nr:transketolase C-terminal domain-containing protein [Candidatus Bipolaricaulota bacterium]
MKKCIEGSEAIAETIKLCRPEVVAVFPITPQTHIIEHLAQYKADGDADYEYIRAESEFSAASIILGAAAMGSRVYTASSSQGLLLMTEVIYNIAGMRLPVVMTAANRAISAPLNIWNDQQDVMPFRDAGWLMLFAEDNQEAVDFHLMAYKIAERFSLPAMVCVDGFVLTHTFETVDLPSSAEVKKFLPRFSPKKNSALDVIRPVSLGCFATPDDYQEIRLELHEDLLKTKEAFLSEAVKFKQIFGRQLNVCQYYGPANAKTVIVSMGSVLGTIKEAVDELNKKSGQVGVLKITMFRPFPEKEIFDILKNRKKVIVLDKSISLGRGGILFNEIKQCLSGSKVEVKGVVEGLGGRDVTMGFVSELVAF